MFLNKLDFAMQSMENKLCYIENLTKAESEVYNLLKACYTDREMAKELFVSINTIKQHVAHIIGKTGMNRRELILYGNVKIRKRIYVTLRQFEIIKLLEQGYKATYISKKMKISTNTVKVHIRNIVHATNLRRNQFMLYDFELDNYIKIKMQNWNLIEKRMKELGTCDFSQYVNKIIENDVKKTLVNKSEINDI